MAISFPNISRSYDKSRKCIRFWGYDGAFEITFFLDLDALSKIQMISPADEATILGTFDRCRARIVSVASAVYRRHRQNAYTLVASDF